MALEKLIIVVGPTGVGKTGFAITLALRCGAQIIGADSMQIYRHLDIGTAKPTAHERAMVPHHLVDCVDPDQPFDAAAYRQRADELVRQLTAKGIVPLVVGGTGLYVKALLYGLFDAAPSDATVRSRLRQEADQWGVSVLYRRLAQVDPEAAARIHCNDFLRITRALEVWELTGHPISAQQATHGFRDPRYDALIFGLDLPRDQLYARIDQRVEAMLAAGLEQEVRHLLDQGVSPRFKSMQSLGYRHMTDYLQGRLTYPDMVRTLKRDHRHYAKRQLTWFRADPSVQWMGPGDIAAVVERVAEFLNPP